MRKIIINISLILLFCSCTSYRFATIDVLQPATYSLPIQIDSILILNNAKEQDCSQGHSTVRKLSKEIQTYLISEVKESKDTVDVDSTTNYAITAFSEAIKQSGIFSSGIKLIPTYDESKKHTRSILDAFKSYNVDAIITLESLNYQDILTYHSAFESELKTITHSDWNIYFISNPLKGHRFSTEESYYWSSKVNRTECIKEAASYNGIKAAKEIFPYWKSDNRLYFGGINYMYTSIDKDIKNNNWKSAATKWKRLYDGEKKSSYMKGKMAYNMALFFEVKNELKTALDWINIANDIFKKKENKDYLAICQEYYSILKKRSENNDTLDKQLFINRVN